MNEEDDDSVAADELVCKKPTGRAGLFYIGNDLVDVSKVHSFTVVGNYVTVSVENKRLYVRQALTRLVERLDPEIFFQANRACVINLAHVKSVQPHDARRLSFTLVNGQTIIASSQSTTRFRRERKL
jgi:two-component system, LytTR family, response regulator